MTDSTIAALATPPGQGGVALLRISGSAARQVAAQIFRPLGICRAFDVLTAPGYTMAYGEICEPPPPDSVPTETTPPPIDEVVLLCYAAPHSYTGEDVVELCCHGGDYVAREVLRVVLAAGAQPAGPGEFTKRAFLNGKLDLTEAEAVMDIISAESTQALHRAVEGRRGIVSRETQALCQELVDLAARMTVWADFPEDDLPVITSEELLKTLSLLTDRLTRLLTGYENTRLLRRGIYTVIAGKPNVGKSSLFNLLAGHPRAIVTEQAGTTRDVIEEQVRLGDVVLRLADTAGIHPATDCVEEIGVGRAREELTAADLVLLVLDGSQPLDADDYAVLSAAADKPSLLIIVNKADLPQQADLSAIETQKTPILRLSALQSAERSHLQEAVGKLEAIKQLHSDSTALFSARQKDSAAQAVSALEQARAAVREGQTLDVPSLLIDEAINALLSLSGERVSDEVIDRVFSTFCIGK